MKLFPKKQIGKSPKINIKNSDNFYLPKINCKRTSLRREKSLYIENNNYNSCRKEFQNFKSIFDNLEYSSNREQTYNNLDNCQFNSNEININFKMHSRKAIKIQNDIHSEEMFESHDIEINNEKILNENGLMISGKANESDKKIKLNKTMYYIKKGIKNSVEIPNIEKNNSDKNNKKSQNESGKENN